MENVPIKVPFVTFCSSFHCINISLSAKYCITGRISKSGSLVSSW